MTHDVAGPSVVSLGSLPLDQIICGDNCEIMRQMPSESIDLVVTSPPYDDLRTYGGHSWDFYGVAWNLKRLLKPGGVIVWVVADATKDGSETGTSMRQALHFQGIGLWIHDTMVYQRKTKPLTHRRYEQEWEYAFVFSSGRPRAWNGLTRMAATAGTKTRKVHHRTGDDLDVRTNGATVADQVLRGNVWKYDVGGPMADKVAFQHPAIFPEALARDHILSWSNPGDVVLDPFSGSGTTAKMARETGRRFIGIEVNPEYVEISRKRLAQQALPMDVA
jgi:site-specific DNA-methyltransferase (adenine-specific)